MITTVELGAYHLIETKGHTKILILDHIHTFAWVSAKNIGELLVASHRSHKVDHMLAAGKYRLYNVSGEEDLTDVPHLELFVGEGLWQGYLLPTGLPDKKKSRNRIIPTKEIITKTTF